MNEQLFDDAFSISSRSNLNIKDMLNTITELRDEKVSKKEILGNASAILASIADKNNLLYRKCGNAHTAKQRLWIDNIYLKGTQFSKIIGSRKSNVITQEEVKRILNSSSTPLSIREMQSKLLQKGIILIYHRALPGSKIDGVIFKTDDSNIVIGMSLRYNRVDYFWFTLAHELSHLLLHSDKLDNGIISIEDDDAKIELEANTLAKKLLVKPSDFRTCIARKTCNNDDVYTFAKSHQVHPAIIAGLLRKELANYTVFSEIIKNSKYYAELNID